MSERVIQIYCARYHNDAAIQQSVVDFMLAPPNPFWNPANVNFKPLAACTISEFRERAALCFGRAAADEIHITAH
jgi:hypothetical protein